MKTTFTILASILTLVAVGQDTTYHNYDGNKVVSFQLCHYYKVIERNSADTNKVAERAYFKSGQIKSERYYQPYSKKHLEGKSKEWYESGKIRREIHYKDGKKDGPLLTFWANGKLKRRDLFEDGELTEGKVWDSEGNQVEYYDMDIMPEFPGGEKALFQFLSKNITYPEKSKRRGVEGLVYVNFTIEKDGSISNINVLQGVNDEIDAEAVLVVSMMPKWSPAKYDGEHVSVSYNLPLKFSLN